MTCCALPVIHGVGRVFGHRHTVTSFVYSCYDDSESNDTIVESVTFALRASRVPGNVSHPALITSNGWEKPQSLVTSDGIQGYNTVNLINENCVQESLIPL